MSKFYSLRGIPTKKNSIIVYKSLAESGIKYCIIAWGRAFPTVFKLHKTLYWNNFPKKRDFSTLLFYQELQVLKIREIYIHKCLITKK